MTKPKLLQKLTTLLHLDLTYFFHGGLWVSVQQIIGVTCGLIVSYIFGHFVSKTVFGEYNLILSIVGMLTFLSLPGIDQALTRSVSQGYDASLIQGQRLKFKTSIVGLPLLLGFAWYYFVHGQQTVAFGLIITAVLFPFLNPFTNYPAYLTGKRQFAILSILASFSSLFFLLVMGGSILLFPQTVPLITAYLTALILPAIFSFWICAKQIPKSAPSDPRLPAYGTFLTLLSVLPWISGNLGNIVLGNSVGVESLAVFAVGSRFLTAVQKNFTVFYKPATAKLASQSANQHLTTLKRHWIKFWIIGVLLALVLWFATPLLITFFFTKQYHDAIRYGQLLSLALIPLPFTWAIEDMLVYQKLKNVQIVDSVFPQIVKILLYLLVIPHWKISGLVVITILDRFTEPIIPLFGLWQSVHNKQSFFAR